VICATGRLPTTTRPAWSHAGPETQRAVRPQLPFACQKQSGLLQPTQNRPNNEKTKTQDTRPQQMCCDHQAFNLYRPVPGRLPAAFGRRTTASLRKDDGIVSALGLRILAAWGGSPSLLLRVQTMLSVGAGGFFCGNSGIGGSGAAASHGWLGLSPRWQQASWLRWGHRLGCRPAKI